MSIARTRVRNYCQWHPHMTTSKMLSNLARGHTQYEMACSPHTSDKSVCQHTYTIRST